MTERSNVVCALCSAETTLESANVPSRHEGPSDFDTRPGEPIRSTIGSWVMSCSNCGYCADDISRASDAVSEIVSSPAYQSWLENVSLPLKARHFLCYSTLLERLHEHADAGWSALHAAWVCDDEGQKEAAQQCRGHAIALWQKGKAAGQQFAESLASEFALVTDLYRRMGEFEHATVACSEGLDLEDVPPTIEYMLRRQMVLIHRRDSSAHSMAELVSQL